jgi:Pyridoxal-phosphate dependent enzyme
VAYAAMRLGVPATIFLPSVTSPSKVERIKSYAANLVVAGERYADALAASEEFARESGALAVHAFDQPETLLGQGTIGREIDADLPDIDTLLVAVGGGGLIGGNAAWFRGRVKIIAVEPEFSPTLWRRLQQENRSMRRQRALRPTRWRPGASARSCFRSRRPSSNAWCLSPTTTSARRKPRCGTRFASSPSPGVLPPLPHCYRANTRRRRTSAWRWWSAAPIRRRFDSTERDHGYSAAARWCS